MQKVIGPASTGHAALVPPLIGTKPRVVAELATLMASAVLALAGAVVVLKLWLAHLNIPISPGGDTMLSLMVVKNMQLTGWFQGTPQLGAPFEQDLTAYPAFVGDFWHMATLKILSTFLSPAASVNVFFVLGFPVIGAAAYICLRVLAVSRPFACVLGAVYALLPFHFFRNEAHLMLSAYFAVPVACVIAVALYQKRLTLKLDRRRLTPTTWVALGGAALLAGTGLYYAAFAMLLIAAAAVLGAVADQSCRPLLSGGILITIIGAGLLVAALPNIVRDAPPGSASAVEGRSYESTEIYGLKITNMLLPVRDHRIPAMDDLQESVAKSPVPGEGTEALGILGVSGLLAAVAALLLPRAGHRGSLSRRLSPLGAMAVVAVLVGSVGGLNSLLAAWGLAELRAWNRISVLVAFLALASLGHVLDFARTRWASRRVAAQRPMTIAAAGLVLLVGAYDQTSPGMIPDYVKESTKWNDDEAYFERVEQRFGVGTPMFALPYVRFPENPPNYDMTDYEHIRGYLHSDLLWSYGGVKGEESEWQPVALQDGIGAALPRLVVAGFEAIYVNRDGYSDEAGQVESEIRSVIGEQTPMVNEAGDLAVYDLRTYAQSLDVSRDPLMTRDKVLYPVRFSYGDGFYPAESSPVESWRWARSAGQVVLVNPAEQAAKVVLSGAVRLHDAKAAIRVRIGDQETQVHPVDGIARFRIVTEVPSGRANVLIATDADPVGPPDDPRDLRQMVLAFTVAPVAVSQ